MAFIKQGSPSTILKVSEVVKEGEDQKIKVHASRPEKPKPSVGDEGDGPEKVGGTHNG